MDSIKIQVQLRRNKVIGRRYVRGREHSLFHKVRVCPIYIDVWILGMFKVMVKEDHGLCISPQGSLLYCLDRRACELRSMKKVLRERGRFLPLKFFK